MTDKQTILYITIIDIFIYIESYVKSVGVEQYFRNVLHSHFI